MCNKRIFKSVLIVLFLAAAWFAFINLIDKPQLTSTPLLIMIWATVLILILLLFPEFLKYIKGFKIEGFEIELLTNIDNIYKTNEIDFRNFNVEFDNEKGKSFYEFETSGNSPIFITARLNIGISISHLFTYCLLYETLGKPVNLLLYSNNQKINKLNEIKSDSIAEIVIGKNILQILFNEYPNLNEVFSFPEFKQALDNFKNQNKNEFVENANTIIKKLIELKYYILKETDIDKLFIGKLNKIRITCKPSRENLLKVYNAVVSDDDYCFLFNKDKLISIISIKGIKKSLASYKLEEVIIHLEKSKK